MVWLVRKSAKFWNLPRSSKWTLLRAWWLLLAAHTRLKFQGFPRTLTWATQPGPTPPPPLPLETALQTSSLVAMAARYQFVEMTCLRQALAACRLLSRQGIDCRLKLGVRRKDGRMEAHAWLEVEGETVPVLGASDRDYDELRPPR